MGNGSVSKTEINRNKEIDKQIDEDRRLQQQTVKLLLLGSGHSGKSTLAKQMKVLRMDGFTDEEVQYYLEHIYLNLVDGVLALVLGLRRLAGFRFINRDTGQCAHELSEWRSAIKPGRVSYGESIAQSVNQILSDADICRELKERAEIREMLPDSAVYFFDRRDEIAQESYKPTPNDIFHCRIPTIGIHELRFKAKNLEFRLIDVGGQEGQRRKWIDQFQGVHGMVFVTAVAEYNMMMEEDPTRNRMLDSLALFRSLMRYKHFQKTAVLIFFNKIDIFRDRIHRIPLRVCFTEYEKENNYEEATEFIKEKFLSMNKSKKIIYTHFTNATDTSNVEQVFNLTFEIVINSNMRSIGLGS